MSQPNGLEPGMDLISPDPPAIFARARLPYALQSYLSENKFQNFVLAVNPQDTQNLSVLAHALVAASSKITRITLNSSDGDDSGVKPLAQLLTEGYQLVKYMGSPHVFQDLDGNTLLALIPCPPPLVRAGLNQIFVEDLKEAKASLGSAEGISDAGAETCCAHSDVCCSSKNCHQLHPFSDDSTTSTILNRSEAIKTLRTWQATCLQSYGIQQQVAVPPFPTATGLNVQYDFGPGSSRSEFAVSGPRAITSGGDYDYGRGGHFVVKEAKLVLEFPPCATVLTTPSAITIGQVPVQIHEYKVTLTSCGP